MNLILITTFTVLLGVSHPLLNDHMTATTPFTMPQLENQILQNLNQETLLRLELERKLHAMEARLESLEGAATRDKQTIESLTAALAQSNAEKKKSTSVLSNRLDFIEQKVPSLENTTDELRQRIHSVEQNIPETEKRLNSVSNMTSVLDHRVGSVELDLPKLDNRMGNVEQTLLQLSSSLSNVTSALDHRLGSVEHDLPKLDSRVGTVEQKLPTLAKKEPAVVFLALLSHDVTATKSGPLIFGNVRVNVGGAYNPSDGMFTAPVSGVYSFSVFLATNDHDDVHGYLKQNGNVIGYVYADINTTGKAPKGSTSTSVHCNQGDKVWFDWIDSKGQLIHSWYYTYFTGHLAHMDQ